MTTPQDLQLDLSQINFNPNDNSNATLFNDSLKSNKDAIDYSLFKTAEITNEVIKDVNNVQAARDISYQILAEPLRAIGSEGSINTNIAANITMAQGVINQAPDKIDKIAALSQNPSAASNSQLKDCLNNASKKSVTIAQTEANHAELANGHEIKSIAGSQTIKANSIRLNSDTTTSIASPHTLTLTQDYQVQANNSYTVISDVSLQQYKQEVMLVEGSSVKQAQTGIEVFTENSDRVSKNTRSIGIESHTVIGKDNNLIADNKLTSISGGDIQTAAYGNVGIQGNGNISIVAAKSNTKGNSSATSDLDSSANSFEYGGAIIMVSNPSKDVSNIFSLSKEGMFSSTTKDMVSTSGGMNVIQGTKGAAVTSQNFSYVGNSSNGIYVKGNKTFIGAFAAPLSTILQPNIVDIPALPVMAKLPNQKLENCIPKEAKTNNATIIQNPTDGGAVSITDSSISNSSTSNNTFNGTSGKEPTASNVKRLPTQSNNPTTLSTIANPLNTPGSKLPIPGSTSFDKNTSASPIFSEAITSIYADKYNPEETANTESNIFDIVSFGETTLPNQLVSFLQDQDYLNDYGNKLIDADSFITTNNITTKLAGVVPSQVLNSLLYPPFYSQLLKLPQELIDSFSLSADNFLGLDSKTVQNILDLFNTYPAAKVKVQDLIKESKAIIAVGFLDFLSNIGLNINTSILKDISQIPNIIQSGNVNSILNIAKPYLNKAIQGSSFETILNNPDLLGLADGVIKGQNLDTLLKTSVDKIYNEKIKQVLTNELSKTLGLELSSAIPLVKSVLNKIKVGQPIKAEDYINEFSSILTSITGSSQISTATSLYNNLKGLITNINSGDILKILSGGSLDSIASTILGKDVSGSLSKIFSTVQSAVGAYEAIKLLPELVDLMNQYNIPAIDQIGIALNCLDLFNKVKDLLDKIGALGNGTNGNKAATSLLENAGNLTQAVNTINSLPSDTIDSLSSSLSSELGSTVDLKQYKLSFSTELGKCFRLPKLNTYQSQVNIISIQNASVIFSLSNYDLFINNPYLLPKINDSIQIRVASFLDLTTNNYFVPYQTDFQYTPSIYTFIISDYDSQNNMGVAVFDNAISTLVLENSQGVLYQYPTEAIGRTLNIDVQEAYLLL